MSRVLDLSVFAKETLDVILPNVEKTVLHLNKPTRSMVMRLMAFKTIEVNDSEVIIERMDTMALEILNTNDAGVAIEREYVENELSAQMKVAIFEAYSAWIRGYDNDPN